MSEKQTSADDPGGAGAWIAGILLYILFATGLSTAQIAWGDYQVNKQPLSVTPATAAAESVGRKTFVELRGVIHTPQIKECGSYVLAPVVAAGQDVQRFSVLARIYDGKLLPDPSTGKAPLVVPFAQKGYLYAIDSAALSDDYQAESCSTIWNAAKGQRLASEIAAAAFIFRVDSTPPAPSLVEDDNFWIGLVVLGLVGLAALGWGLRALSVHARRQRRTRREQLGAWTNQLRRHRLIYLKTFGYMAVTSTLGGIYALVSEQVIYGLCVAAAANYLLIYNPLYNRQRLEVFHGMIGDLLIFGAVGVTLSLYGVLGTYGGGMMFGLGFVYLIVSATLAHKRKNLPAHPRYDRLSLYAMEYATAVGVFALGEIIRNKIAPPDWEGAASASAIGFLALLFFLHGPYLIQSAGYDRERFSVVVHRTIALTIEGFIFYAFYP